MKHILLDTNILLAIEQHGLDIDELSSFGNLVVITSVLEEIENISFVGGKDGKAAKIALQIIEKLKIEKWPSKGQADDALLKCAQEKDAFIATLDKELRKRARKKGIELIGFINGKIGTV